MQIILGHIVYAACDFKPLLCILQISYAFVCEGTDVPKLLPDEVVCELLVVARLLPVSYVDLCGQACEGALMSDACVPGYAVHRGELGSKLVFALAPAPTLSYATELHWPKMFE